MSMDEADLDPTDCLEYGPDCAGPVAYRHPGVGQRSWPRCAHHGDARVARVSELERWADASPGIRPDWFDESAAGERWDEEDC